MPKVKRLTGHGKNYTNFYRMAEELKETSLWVMGNMHSQFYLDGYGALPTDFYDSVIWADYIIYSYNTPIAWRMEHNPNLWVVPDKKYSNTTTRHQGRILTALSVMENVTVKTPTP